MGTSATAATVGRGLGWSTANNVVLRVGNFLVSILMARLIAPDQFGVFAVALTVWTMLGALAEFGLGTDLVRAPDVEARIPTVAVLGLTTSGTLALLMAAAAGPIADAFQSPESTTVIRLMSLSLFVFGFSIVPAALLQREFRQAALFAINGVSLVVSAATMTLLALSGSGPAALAWGQIVGQVVIVAGAFWATGSRLRLGFDRSVAKQSATFCLPLAGANLLSWLLLSVDNVVVARVLGPEQLGLYVLAFNVSSWPMAAVGQSIRVVALPAFSRLESAEMRNRALVQLSGPLWTICCSMAVMLGALALPLITLLYGVRWQPAVAALSGLALFGALRVVFDLLATFLIAAGDTRAVLAVQTWWLLVMIPAMIAGVRWFGLAGAGWTHLLVGAVAVLPAYLLCLRRLGADWLAFVRAWVLPTVGVVPAALLCRWTATLGWAPFPTLLVGGLSVVILFCLPLAPWWVRHVRLLSSLGTAEPIDVNK